MAALRPPRAVSSKVLALSRMAAAKRPKGLPGPKSAGSWLWRAGAIINVNVQNRILALVKAILDQNSIVSEVLPELRLVDVGLTSMDMVNLMLGVEAEFDFTIPQAEITPENFQSIKTLELMIVNQLQPGTAPNWLGAIKLCVRLSG